MKRLLALLVAIAVIAVIGCASNNVSKGYVNVVPDEINKLIKTEYSEDIYAVGTAVAKSEGVALVKAALQARAIISRQFESKVAALQNDYKEEINGRPAGEFTSIISELTNVTLVNSTEALSMVKKENGEYKAKVLVVISSEQLKDMLDQKLRDYTSFRASKAYEELLNRLKTNNN